MPIPGGFGTVLEAREKIIQFLKKKKKKKSRFLSNLKTFLHFVQLPKANNLKCITGCCGLGFKSSRDRMGTDLQ